MRISDGRSDVCSSDLRSADFLNRGKEPGCFQQPVIGLAQVRQRNVPQRGPVNLQSCISLGVVNLRLGERDSQLAQHVLNLLKARQGRLSSIQCSLKRGDRKSVV